MNVYDFAKLHQIDIVEMKCGQCGTMLTTPTETVTTEFSHGLVYHCSCGNKPAILVPFDPGIIAMFDGLLKQVKNEQ